jgi:hypothetical protein
MTAETTVSASRERERLVMIRDAFHQQGPFLGSGGPYNPGPATTSPLLAMPQPLNGTLAPPWALRRSSPVLAVRPTRDCTFRPMRLPTVSPADLRSELGPRSLDPAALFGARLPSLFEARRRLPTSATETRRTSNPTGTLDPRRDEGLDLLPCLRHATLPSLQKAVTCGEPRCVRPNDPSVDSSHLRGFAQP